MSSAIALVAAEATRATMAVFSAAGAGAGTNALVESRAASATVALRYTGRFILASSARTLACITSRKEEYGVFTLSDLREDWHGVSFNGLVGRGGALEPQPPCGPK